MINVLALPYRRGIGICFRDRWDQDEVLREAGVDGLGPGSGIAYFGYTPQAYFGNEPASAPADVAREAAGLASWLTRLQGRTDEAALRELIAPFIADDTQEQLDEDDEDLLDGDSDDLDDADIFVQFKVARFLQATGLPAPGGLPC